MSGVTYGVFQEVRKEANAALVNEQLTRRRVADLEARVEQLAGLLARDFWGRLRWLITGR